MGDEFEYDDGNVALDGSGVLLRRYYFPTGRSKRIPYSAIRGLRVRRMGWLTGKGRLWGTAHPGYWLPYDGKRPRKERLVVLDVGGRVKPACTPADVDRAVELIRRNLRR